jgi:hypothetical protein
MVARSRRAGRSGRHSRSASRRRDVPPSNPTRLTRAEQLRTSWSCGCGFMTNFAARATCFRCAAAPAQGAAAPSSPSRRTKQQQQKRGLDGARVAAAAAAPSVAASVAALPAPAGSDPLLIAVQKRLSDRVSCIQAWLRKQPDDAAFAALLAATQLELAEVKARLQELRPLDARLVSCLGRQQGLAKTVAKLQVAQEACQAALLQSTERLSAAQASLVEAESESQQVAQLLVAAAPLGTRPVAAGAEDDDDEDDPMGFTAPCRLKRPRDGLGSTASAAAFGAASSAAAVVAPSAAGALVLAAPLTLEQLPPPPGELARLAQLAVGAHTKAMQGLAAYRASHPPGCDPPPEMCAGLTAKAAAAALATSASAAAAAAFLPARFSDPRKHG